MARKANWCERYLGSDHHTDRFVGSIVKYENKSGTDFHHLPKDYYTVHCPRNVKQLVVEAEEDGPRRHLLSQVRAFKAGYSEAPSRSSSPRPTRRFSVDYGVIARRPRSRAVSPAPPGRDYRSVTPSCSRPDSLPPASRVNSARSSVARDSGPQDFESTPYKPVLEERPRASVPRASSLQRSIPKMGRYRSASFSAGSGYSPEYSVVRTGMTKGYDDVPSPAYAMHRAAAISRYTQDDAADLASRSRRADRDFLDAVTRRIAESTAGYDLYRSRSAHVSRATTPVRSRAATPHRYSASYTVSRAASPVRGASPVRAFHRGVYGSSWSASDDAEVLDYLYHGTSLPSYESYRPRYSYSAHVSRASSPVRTTYVPYTPVSTYASSYVSTPYTYSTYKPSTYVSEPYTYSSPYSYRYTPSWTRGDSADVDTYLSGSTFTPRYYYSSYWSPYSTSHKEIDLTEDEPSYSYRSQASKLRSSLNLYPEPKERNTADMSWYLETPLNYMPSLYGQLHPPIYTSPAFMMGYHSAAQAAGTMSRRQRKRATSVGPTSSAADLYSSYTRYPSGRLRSAAIEDDYPSSSYYSVRVTKRIESQEEESELPPPMSLHSIRNRLLSCADLNDSAKRLYDRYIPVGVEGLEFGSKRY